MSHEEFSWFINKIWKILIHKKHINQESRINKHHTLYKDVSAVNFRQKETMNSMTVCLLLLVSCMVIQLNSVEGKKNSIYCKFGNFCENFVFANSF